MLTHERLMDLFRQLRDQKVLSVYLDAEQNNPAERNKWRVRLEHEMSRKLRETSDLAERGRLEQAWRQLQDKLSGYDAFLPEKGWVGFATPDSVWYAENVSAPMPTGVYWEEGARVAPYVRALKQQRAVMVLLLDTRRARIFRYHNGDAVELADERADTWLGDLADVSQSKRGATHTGMRGETATDTAQRALDLSADRMVKDTIEEVVQKIGNDGFLVLGGVTEAVARVWHLLPKGLERRTIEMSSLHVDMTPHEVRASAQEAATLLTERMQTELLHDVIETSGGEGRGCLGPAETIQALAEMRVDTLLLSRDLMQRDPDLADRCVGQALAQDAGVEEVSGEAQARLDEGGGMAARLRYRVRKDGRRPLATAGDESGHHR
jgi:hypothetical protein